MRLTLSVAVIVSWLASTLAVAGPIRVCREVPNPSGGGTFITVDAASVDDPPSPAFTDTFAWNNWTTPLWPYFGGPGRTLIGPPLIIGSHEVGEDVQLVPGTGGIWSDRGFSMHNGSATD
jgi:hypothetical protein